MAQVCGGSCCPANQMTRGEGIFQSRGRTFISSGSLESSCLRFRVQFSFKGKSASCGFSNQAWMGGVRRDTVAYMPHFCIPSCTSLLPKLLSYHSLNETFVSYTHHSSMQKDVSCRHSQGLSANWSV